MLSAAQQEYDNQQRLTALGVLEAQRLATRGATFVAQSVQQYQAAAVEVSMASLGAILAEQGISQAAQGVVQPAALLTDAGIMSAMLNAADTPAAMVRLVSTLIGDAARTARTVDGFTRPAVTGYIRSLRPPSCRDCVILAGRVYRFSTGFERHPGDDCLMTPTTQVIGPQLVTDPMEAFRNGWIKDLSRDEHQRVTDGADLISVVNERRSNRQRKKRTSVQSSVIGKASPQQLLAALHNRVDAFAALKEAGFIVPAAA